jgi:hypothetical protein
LQWTNDGIQARENHMPVATTSAREASAQMASAESSNPNQQTADYTVIYDRGIGSGAGTSDDVLAALVVGSYGGAISSFCGPSALYCPCGITISGANTACPNSWYDTGAHLTASGTASTTADTLAFSITSMPGSQTSLVYQGTGVINGGNGATFGDGRRCVGGAVVRFAPHANDASGNSYYPQSGNPSISVMGGVPLMGGTFYYQTWYRDPAVYCFGATTNLSNALAVTWTP